MYSVQLSTEAIHDLTEIRDYIAQELENPEAALRTISGITKRLRMLATHPHLGASLTSVVDLETDERFLVCGHYLAFYHMMRNAVAVDRILYNKRDYQTLFQSDKDH